MRYILSLLLLVNIASAADYTLPEDNRKDFVLGTKTNLYFDNVEEKLTKFILDYHTNQDIPKTIDDCIQVTQDINGDMYVTLYLQRAVRNAEYNSIKAGFCPPPMYKYMDTNTTVCVFSTYRLLPQVNDCIVTPEDYVPSGLEDSEMEDFIKSLYPDESDPNKYLPHNLARSIIADFQRMTNFQSGNIKYVCSEYKDVKVSIKD